ncbi:hypothetical protein CB1_000394030 [Camelus ferus]|nr:hypothetical protein CB1_000394030 [Camelus ferus]
MLRDKIAQIDKVMCEGSLHVLRLALTRNNCVKVYNKLKLMATVHQTQPTVQVLLSTSEFVGALDLIATTQEVLQQELQGIHSFRHLGSQLCELEKLIDKMMIAEFSTYSHSDLNRPLEDDCQILEEATLNIIHSVVLSVLDKNQRTRELEEISQQKNTAKDNSLDTEVAYLIHEGMFISDAFSESELTPIAIDTASQRNASPNSEPCSSDSVSEPECTTDSSSSKEQTSSSVTPGGVDIILLLDNERWKQADVPAEFQDLVDSISDGKIALPEKKSGATEERKPAEVLIVEGQQYAVVGTVLLLIRIILEYCQCVDNIPSVTTDMLTRLSDLLKLIVHYIPVIRAHFEARLQPKQYSMLRHFDHITKDYHDHIAEISAKLVAIMDGLFDKLLSKTQQLLRKPSLQLPQCPPPMFL